MGHGTWAYWQGRRKEAQIADRALVKAVGHARRMGFVIGIFCGAAAMAFTLGWLGYLQ